MTTEEIREAAEDAIPERHQSLAEDIDAVLEAVEPLIRKAERVRISMELAAYADELMAAGRTTASGLVKDMWKRVNRRLDR